MTAFYRTFELPDVPGTFGYIITGEGFVLEQATDPVMGNKEPMTEAQAKAHAQAAVDELNAPPPAQDPAPVDPV